MGDSLISVVAIILAAVLIFVLPVMAMANRQDNILKSTVQTATDEFVDEIKTTGKLTEEKYNKFLQNIGSTGNIYESQMEIKKLDENQSKKTLQTETDKIGENLYYTLYNSQIDQALKDNKGVYKLQEGDIITVTVKNTNLSAAQQIANQIYKVFGNNTYTIMASAGGMVTTTAK